MPDTIQSSKFSFVRFEHPTDDGVSFDIPYTLPVFGKHDTAFQFIVAMDRDINSPIKLGLADPDGGFLIDFGNTFFAQVLSYRFRLAGLLDHPVIELNQISFNGVSKIYPAQVMNLQGLADVLSDDFGLELNGDQVISTINSDLTILAVWRDQLSFPRPLFNEGAIPKYWNEGYVSIQGIDISNQYPCFTYALLEVDNTVIAYSNDFQLSDEEIYTSHVRYSCNSDAFEFTYNGFAENRVRLPIYLKNPDFPQTQTVNRFSDGSVQLITGLVEKQYVIDTEQMPEVFHECLTVAFTHDTCIINNVNIREKTVKVIKVESYTTVWESETTDYPFCKGKGKIKVANFSYANSNC